MVLVGEKRYFNSERNPRRLPQARQVPDFDDAILSHRQDALLLLIHVDIDYRVLGVEKGRERRPISILKRGVTCVADSDVVLEAHDWNVDSIWRTIITNCLAAVSVSTTRFRLIAMLIDRFVTQHTGSDVGD